MNVIIDPNLNECKYRQQHRPRDIKSLARHSECIFEFLSDWIEKRRIDRGIEIAGYNYRAIAKVREFVIQVVEGLSPRNQRAAFEIRINQPHFLPSDRNRVVPKPALASEA